jgi:hypothetical protein
MAPVHEAVSEHVETCSVYIGLCPLFSGSYTGGWQLSGWIASMGECRLTIKYVVELCANKN